MTHPPDEGLVCRCYRVSETTIRGAIAAHSLRQVEEVTALTRAGGGCSSCWDDIQAILDTIHGRSLPRDVPDASGLSSAQKRALVVRAIEAEVQALFEVNGLQLQLVDVTGDRVLARFYGSAAEGSAPSFLAIKRYLVQRMSAACGHKMQLVELNVLEALGRPSPS